MTNTQPQTTAQLNGQAAAVARIVAERQPAVAAFGFSAGTIAAAGIKR